MGSSGIWAEESSPIPPPVPMTLQEEIHKYTLKICVITAESSRRPERHSVVEKLKGRE